MSQPALALVILTLSALALVVACNRPPPPKHYALEGQVLAVDPKGAQITIKHGDIPGFMPAMTMTYLVATPTLLEGRAPGELVTATLEIDVSTPKLVAITHAGSAPLPQGSNEVAMASGVIAVGDEAPEAAFIDQTDRRRSFSEWRGSITLLTFAYTRCPLPDFCPLMDRHFAAIQRGILADSALSRRAKLVTVSFDPEFDSPQVLRRHAATLKADPSIWTFLTGDRQTIDRFAARFGVGVIRDQQDGTQITHNLRTTLIDPNGRVAKIYSGSDWTPDGVLADLRTLGGPGDR